MKCLYIVGLREEGEEGDSPRKLEMTRPRRGRGRRGRPTPAARRAVRTKQTALFDHLFDDKRVLILFVFAWMIIVSSVFVYIMTQEQSPFLSFGPNDHTLIFGFKLNTWTRWGCVAMYTFINTCISDFTFESIGPWITNTIQDHKNAYLPYSKGQCLCIAQTFWAYGSVSFTISMFVSLTQIDFTIIRMCAAALVNYYSTSRFMEDKKVDANMYKQSLVHDNRPEKGAQRRVGVRRRQRRVGVRLPLVNYYSTSRFMEDKKVDANMYKQSLVHDNRPDDDTVLLEADSVV